MPPVPGAPAAESQQPTGGNEGACPRGGESQPSSNLGAAGATPEPDPNGLEQADDLSPGAMQVQPEQGKSVAAEGVEGTEPGQELSDPFLFTFESEEEKLIDARWKASYDEYLGRGGIRDPSSEPDIQTQEPAPEASEYKAYEPPPMLELVRRGGQVEVARVEWHNGCSMLIDQGNRYRTPAMPSSVYHSMYLPTDVGSYASARGVYQAIYDVLKDCSFLSEQQCELLSFWSLATWFSDRLDFLPRLSISGPRFAAELLFTLLKYVCHKAITVVGMSPLLVKQTAMEKLKPTLLIYQVKPSTSATELLDASDVPGRLIACAGELVQFCCPKAVYFGEKLDPKKTLNGLDIHLGRNAPVPERPYLSAAGIEKLQNKLLAYRSFNLKRTDFLEVPPGELQPQLDVFARRLGAVVVNDPALQHRLIEILKEQSEQVRAERASGIEGCVLQAVLGFAHGNEGEVYVGTIAAVAKQIGIDQGEPLSVSPERSGRALHRLGLYTRRLGSQGRGLVFDKATQLRVHQLSREYDVMPVVPECGFCQQMQSSEDK